jgi:hypothetical protein
MNGDISVDIEPIHRTTGAVIEPSALRAAKASSVE